MDPTKRMAVVMITASFMSLMAGYAILRHSTNAVFNWLVGVEYLPTASIFVPVVVFLVLTLYSLMIKHWGPRRTLQAFTFGALALLLSCCFAVSYQLVVGAVLLFVLKESYVVLIIEQYWSFLNSHLTKDQAKLTNGLVLGFSSLGAVGADLFCASFGVALGTEAMLYIAAGSLLPCGIFSHQAYRLIGEGSVEQSHASTKPEAGGFLGIKLLSQNKTLQYILILIVSSQCISTLANFNFQHYLVAEFSSAAEQMSYSGKCFAWMHTSAMVLQFVFVPIVLKYFKLSYVHFIIPACHIGVICWFLLYPRLETAVLVLMVFKALDYSLFRASKEILYIPLSFEARFQAKELIDVLGYRVSGGMASLLVSTIQRLGFAGGPLTLGVLNLCAAGVWLASSAKLLSNKEISTTKKLHVSKT